MSSPSTGGIYCGEFGDERLAAMYAVEVGTGLIRWSVCLAAGHRAAILGRAPGITLITEGIDISRRDVVAIADDGSELWRRPADPFGRFVLGTSTYLPFFEPGVGTIEAIDVGSGLLRWTHPASEGMPVAAGNGLIIEVIGAPYTEALSDPQQSAPVEVMLQAVRENSGKTVWSLPVAIAPAGPMSNRQPTAGNDVVAVPSAGSTTVIDLATGLIVREDPLELRAVGDVLVSTDWNADAQWFDAATGERLVTPDGADDLWEPPNSEVSMSGTDVLVYLLGTRAPSFAVVDGLTGTIRWSDDSSMLAGRFGQSIASVDRATVRVSDMSSGEQSFEWTLPVDRAVIAGATIAGDLVLVVPGSGDRP